MDATVYVAFLAHGQRNGTAIGDGPAPGAPLHLSLHTTAEGAKEALDAAMVSEWQREYAWRLGLWDRARRSRRMVEDGYMAAVTERAVAFAPESSDAHPADS